MHLRRIVIIAAAAVSVASLARADEGAPMLQCDNQEDTSMYKKQLKVCEESKRVKETAADSAEQLLREAKAELETTKKMFHDVKKNAESFEAANKHLTAELAASKAALDKSKETEELKAALSKVEAQNKELYESANQATMQFKKTKSQLEASEERLKGVEGEKEKEVEKHKASQAKLRAEIEAHVSKHASAVTEMQAATRRLAELEQSHRKLEDELVKKTRVLYSAEIFWTQFDQVKQILGAFARLFKNRAIEILGADNLELLRLQSTIWFNKSCEKASVLMAPVNRKMNEMYRVHAEEPMKPYLAKGRQLYAESQEWTKDKVEHVGRWSEAYMDRLVHRLSTQDPSVRHLFPDSYWDRLACFAFIFGIFYVLIEVVQWAVSTLIISPISYCFCGGCNKNSRKGSSKKTGQKPSTSISGKKGSVSQIKPRLNKPETAGSVETAPSETDVKATTDKKKMDNKMVGKSVVKAK